MSASKVFAQAGLDHFDDLARGRNRQQPYGQLVDFVGDLGVGARYFKQVDELAVQLAIALAQDLHLFFDQRCRRPAGHVWHAQLSQQLCVALKKFRVVLEVVGNGFFRYAVFEDAGFFQLGSHRSIYPPKTSSAGPVSHSVWPGPGHSTVSVPPGSATSTVSSRLPQR